MYHFLRVILLQRVPVWATISFLKSLIIHGVALASDLHSQMVFANHLDHSGWSSNLLRLTDATTSSL